MTPQADKARARAGWWAAAALLALTAALIVVRAWLVDRNVGAAIACHGCFHVDVLLADLLLFTALASLLLLASCAPTRALARFAHLAAGFILLVYIADLVVFRLYSSRLLMVDVALFISEGAAIWDQFSGGMGGSLTATAVLAGLLALFAFLWWMPTVRTRRFRLSAALLLAVSLAASAYLKGTPYVNDWAVENVFTANMSTPSRNLYSPEIAQRILDRPVRRKTWSAETAPPAGGRNVVLVLVESWSAWHSDLFGGFEDWTPELDEAARRGLRFENFHSIGFSTDKGLVGILAGQQIWAPFRHWFETPPFHSMWGIEDTLPNAFNPGGYHTAFLTTGPLDLYEKGRWLRDIGFDEVEGNEHPFYAHWERYAFGSAPDRALYQRALEWMVDAPEPWLLVLETVTTHQPYVDPESKELSLELAMKYADREFGSFLEGLDSRAFFKNGMLTVVSDHRTMTPMSKRELDIWGAAAHSVVPAFAIGDEFEPGSVDPSAYSQSDLTPSFEWWVSGTVSLEPFEAVMLDPAFETGKCAFYERSDRRGLVEVVCDDAHGQVILDGDHTRFTEGAEFSPESREKILQVIARERLEARQRHLSTAGE